MLDVISGYAGGDEKTANYEAVSTGSTKHAEAVQIIYDPKTVTYEQLLKVHFATHDPTTLNRQGNDVGPQYRSAIFYKDEQEKQLAEAFIADVNDAEGVQEADRHDARAAGRSSIPPRRITRTTSAATRGRATFARSRLPKVEKVREKFKDLVKSE